MTPGRQAIRPRRRLSQGSFGQPDRMGVTLSHPYGRISAWPLLVRQFLRRPLVGRYVDAVDIEVVVVRDVTDDIVEAMVGLVGQLSKTAPPPDAGLLERIVASDTTTLLVARLGGSIVGTLTLVTFLIPTGLRARIEDVVVDESARGQGVGAALTQDAVRLAQGLGARTIDLTSRPSREAANRLYERLGFQLRDSRVYRFTGSQ